MGGKSIEKLRETKNSIHKRITSSISVHFPMFSSFLVFIFVDVQQYKKRKLKENMKAIKWRTLKFKVQTRCGRSGGAGKTVFNKKNMSS